MAFASFWIRVLAFGIPFMLLFPSLSEYLGGPIVDFYASAPASLQLLAMVPGLLILIVGGVGIYVRRRAERKAASAVADIEQQTARP